MNINDITAGEIKDFLAAIGKTVAPEAAHEHAPHPMLGRRCVIRTYSAGVHIGTVEWVNPDNSQEVKLKDALRLWKWTGGGLSLSAVANNGIKNGRVNRTGEVFLTNAIEYIPTTQAAEDTYVLRRRLRLLLLLRRRLRRMLKTCSLRVRSLSLAPVKNNPTRKRKQER